MDIDENSIIKGMSHNDHAKEEEERKRKEKEEAEAKRKEQFRLEQEEEEKRKKRHAKYNISNMSDEEYAAWAANCDAMVYGENADPITGAPADDNNGDIDEEALMMEEEELAQTTKRNPLIMSDDSKLAYLLGMLDEDPKDTKKKKVSICTHIHKITS